MKNSEIPKNTGGLIAWLAKHKGAFSAADAALKMRLIEELSQRIITGSRQLFDYHEALCFIQAYPDNPALSRLVDRELLTFADRVERHKSRNPGDSGLDDSGIVDTPIYYPYNLNTVRWLMGRFGPNIDIDWDDYIKRDDDPLTGLLPLYAVYLENDGIDDEELSSSDWIKMAKGKDLTSLEWLLGNLDDPQLPADVRKYMYDNAKLMLRWDLGRTNASRTLARLPGRRVFYQRGPLKRGEVDLNRSIKKLVPELKAVPPNQACDLIEILIRALLPRHRELYPATYANPDEVYFTSPGRGLEIYIMGMKPENRMPLESNYSALLIKNGVPIGYGIAVMFFERCELAINVFDTFRSGEAALIFEHFAKILYHHFGARDFLMRRWQIGYDNEEGLQSGSFWFYYKLGFRPLDPEVNDLAAAQWRKIQNNRNYRSDLKTLKKLAQSDMHIAPGRIGACVFNELSVIQLGLAVTRQVAGRFDGDRQAAQCWSTEHIAGLLVADINSLTPAERLQFERFAPLLALIRDLESWSASDKQDLIAIIKAKSATRELDYIQALQRHKKFQKALRGVAAEI